MVTLGNRCSFKAGFDGAVETWMLFGEIFNPWNCGDSPGILDVCNCSFCMWKGEYAFGLDTLCCIGFTLAVGVKCLCDAGGGWGDSQCFHGCTSCCGIEWCGSCKGSPGLVLCWQSPEFIRASLNIFACCCCCC